MKTIVAATIALAISATPSLAYTITNDGGGATAVYQNGYRQIARSGERVVIDGPCYSACTLVFKYVPHNRICVTQRAVMGFHRFSYDANGRYDDQATTQKVIRGYPPYVRSWIARRGGYGGLPGAGHFLYMQSPELTRVLRPC